MGIKIIGTGKYLPEKVITNEDISQHVDTSHEWILDRTGIEQRRIATTESSLDMAAAAAEQALQGIDKDSIGSCCCSNYHAGQHHPEHGRNGEERAGTGTCHRF